MALKPELQNKLNELLTEEYKKVRRSGELVIFLSSRTVRAGIFYLLERLFPIRNFVVLAHEEIPSDVKINVVGQITLRSRQAEEVTVA